MRPNMTNKLFQYYWLARDSFFNSLLVPFKDESIYKALLDFGQVPILHIVIIAVISGLAGSCLTWLIGRVFINWGMKQSATIAPEKLEKFSIFFNKYLKWLLLFSWMDMVGNLLVLASGIFKTRFRIFVLLVLAGRILYYGRFLIGAIK